MTGKDLKEKLLCTTGLSLADIAAKIGITPQHLNQQLSVLDVKSGFLEKVCEAFGWTMGQLYGETTPVAAPVDADVEALRKEIERLTIKNETLFEVLKGFGWIAPTEQKRNVV